MSARAEPIAHGHFSTSQFPPSHTHSPHTHYPRLVFCPFVYVRVFVCQEVVGLSVLQRYLKQTRIFCIVWIRCVFVNIVFIFIFLFVVSLVLWYIFVHTCIYSSLWTIWIIGTVNKLHPARKCCASEPSFLVLSRTHIPFSPPPPEASRGTCFITIVKSAIHIILNFKM